MSTEQTIQNDDTKSDDEALKPISADDLIAPTEKLQKTSAMREWKIRRLQRNLGVSREIAERMVDESGE